MNILLVESHVMVSQALKFYLEDLDPSLAITTADSSTEAIRLFAKRPDFDLVLLGSRMAELHGLACFKTIASHFPNRPVVILSGVIDRSDALRAIQAGAAGIIPQHLSAEAIIHALKLILSGETYLPSMILGAPEAGRAALPDEDLQALRGLTPRQRDVLKLLVEGLRNKEIAERLGIREVTVKLHLSKIFKKLGAANRTAAVRIVMEMRA